MTKGIFKDIKPGKSLDHYEKIFFELTNKKYNEYLLDEYINKNLSGFQIAQHLGTKEIVVITHLNKYNIKKTALTKQESNNVLHKTPSMVDEELEGKLYETYNELIKKGMSQTQIAAHFKIRNISSLGNYIKRYEENLKGKDESKLIIKGLKGKRPSTVNDELIKHFDITYEEFLREKYLNQKLSVKEISEMIGISPRRITDHIKNFGFSKTNSQARKEAMEMGRINQTEINKKSRISMAKRFSRSNKQDILRELIKHHLELTVTDYPGIEIVTGYNEFCVLNSLEIDIPVIIFYENKTYKIAIEYDGYVWHENREKDTEKEILLKDKQWHLLRVEETAAHSNNLGKVEEKAKFIVNQIKSIIDNS